MPPAQAAQEQTVTPRRFRHSSVGIVGDIRLDPDIPLPALATTPDETVNQVSQLGGHFATAYKDLLKFISDTESNLEYEWAVPEKQTTTRRRISSVQAKPLYEALIQRTDIGKEMVRLVGKLTKVEIGSA